MHFSNFTNIIYKPSLGGMLNFHLECKYLVADEYI